MVYSALVRGGMLMNIDTMTFVERHFWRPKAAHDCPLPLGHRMTTVRQILRRALRGFHAASTRTAGAAREHGGMVMLRKVYFLQNKPKATRS
jgi:hypothetical protein